MTPQFRNRRCGFRQTQIIAFVRSLTESAGYDPTCREIMFALGMPPDAQGNVSRMIYSLERRGEIEIRREGRARRITIKR